MKNCEESTSWGSVLLGVVFGAVIGAGTALLLAPQSGKETRDELLERLEEIKDRVDATTHQVANSAKEKLAEAGNDLSRAVEAGRTAAKARAAELRNKMDME